MVVGKSVGVKQRVPAAPTLDRVPHHLTHTQDHATDQEVTALLGASGGGGVQGCVFLYVRVRNNGKSLRLGNICVCVCVCLFVCVCV